MPLTRKRGPCENPLSSPTLHGRGTQTRRRCVAPSLFCNSHHSSTHTNTARTGKTRPAHANGCENPSSRLISTTGPNGDDAHTQLPRDDNDLGLGSRAMMMHAHHPQTTRT